MVSSCLFILTYFLSVSPADFFKRQVKISTITEVFLVFPLLDQSLWFFGSVNVYDAFMFFMNCTFYHCKIFIFIFFKLLLLINITNHFLLKTLYLKIENRQTLRQLQIVM